MLEIHIGTEEVFKIGSFGITNSLLTSFFIFLTFLFLIVLLRRKLSLIPNQLQNFIEFVIEIMLKWMDSVLQDRKLSEKYLPLIATLFLFILFSNWVGLIPGVGSVGLEKDKFVSFLRPPSTDLNFTIALSIISVFAANLFGSIVLGVKRHFSKFFTLKNPIFSFVGLLELLSEFIKIISFSFRLFGNIFAGKVLLIIIAFLVPYVLPLPFLLLEFFIGFIQAFIFAQLTLVFIATAVSTTNEH